MFNDFNEISIFIKREKSLDAKKFYNIREVSGRENRKEVSSDSGSPLHLSLGSGGIRKITLSSGIFVVIQNYELNGSLTTDIEYEKFPLKFNYCLSGKFDGVIENFSNNLTIRPLESSLLSVVGRFSGSMNRLDSSPVKMVTVFFEPEKFKSYFSFDRDIHIILKNFITREENLEIKGKLSRKMRLLVEDLIFFGNHGSMGPMIFESKILELISCHLQEMIRNGDSSKLISCDMEKMNIVRQILLKDLNNPPEMSELAREVGISHTKLINSFRSVYGTTPYRYLRDLRLDRAREVLLSGEMNVTEAAYEAGYNCMSFFSKSFRERFGLSPSQCRRKQDFI